MYLKLNCTHEGPFCSHVNETIKIDNDGGRGRGKLFSWKNVDLNIYVILDRVKFLVSIKGADL